LLGAITGTRPFFHFNSDLAFKPFALYIPLQDFFADHEETVVVHNHLIEVEPDTDDWVRSWHELRSLFDRVIVLTRRNQVKQFLSKVVSEFRDSIDGPSLDHWNCRERRPTDPTILFDFDHYKHFREHLRSSTLQILNLVYPYYPITYDDLVSDWESTMQGIYKYLGFEWDDPKPTTFKQEYRDIQQIISNWQNLPDDQKLQLIADDIGA